MAMTMNGEYQLPAPQETVWEKLNDPADAEGLHSRAASRSTKCPTPNSRRSPRSRSDR